MPSSVRLRSEGDFWEALPLAGLSHQAVAAGAALMRAHRATMKQLLIVYHTVTGGTLQMARAAAAGGSRESTVRVRLETAAAAGPDALLESSGYLFACPENLAAMSGMMKDFFDRTYYPVLESLRADPTRLSFARAAMAPMQPGRSSASLPAGGSRRLPIPSSCVRTPRHRKRSSSRSKSRLPTWRAARSSGRRSQPASTWEFTDPPANTYASGR